MSSQPKLITLLDVTMGSRIVVDVRCLQDSNFAEKGIGLHTVYVLSLIKSLSGVQLIPIIDPNLGKMSSAASALFDGPEQTIDHIDGDIFIEPSPLTHSTGPFARARQIGLKTWAIVYDFIPMHDAAYLNNPIHAVPYRYLVRSLEKYDALLPISHYVKSEIATYVPGYQGKIIPVRCKSRFWSAHEANAEPAIGDDASRSIDAFIFVAASDHPRKNVELPLRAASGLRQRGLGMVIGGGLSKRTQKRMNRIFADALGGNAPQFLSRKSDAELRHIYLQAQMTVVGSLDEGFSLPVAEAISLNRLVVASDIPAHREQIADTNLLFDPHDTGSFLRAIDYARSLAPIDAERARLLYCPLQDQKEVIDLTALFNWSLEHTHAKATAYSATPAPLGEAENIDRLKLTQLYDWLFLMQDSPHISLVTHDKTTDSNAYIAWKQLPSVSVTYKYHPLWEWQTHILVRKTVTLWRKRYKVKMLLRHAILRGRLASFLLSRRTVSPRSPNP